MPASTDRQGRPRITPAGRRILEDRVSDIRERRLAELRPLLVEVERDERHVAAFEQLLAEADDLDRFLANISVISIDPKRYDGRIVLGVRVEIGLADGTTAWVIPVHPREAAIDDERISVDSPLGQAIIGAQVGDEVRVDAPSGAWQAKVLAVDITDVKRVPAGRATQ